jgi:hypothetical protein
MSSYKLSARRDGRGFRMGTNYVPGSDPSRKHVRRWRPECNHRQETAGRPRGCDRGRPRRRIRRETFVLFWWPRPVWGNRAAHVPQFFLAVAHKTSNILVFLGFMAVVNVRVGASRALFRKKVRNDPGGSVENLYRGAPSVCPSCVAIDNGSRRRIGAAALGGSPLQIRRRLTGRPWRWAGRIHWACP